MGPSDIRRAEGRILRTLGTVEGVDPEEGLLRISARLAEVTESDYVTLFGVHRVAGSLVYRDEFGWGDAAIGALWKNGVGGPFLADQHGWHPEAPRPADAGSFRTMRQLRQLGRARRTGLWRSHYRALGIQDQVRTLVFDGPCFVAWVGGLRRGDRPRYGRAGLALFRRVQRPLVQSVVALDRLRRVPSDAEAGYVIVSPEGRVAHACRRASGWLDRGRRSLLAEVVRRFDADPRSGPVPVWNGQAVAHRLDGPEGVRYLVTLSAGHPVMRDRLTERQQEVAELAAVGATASEIAAELGISVFTVKQHLKAVYRALGVANRAELARELAARTARQAG